ncbi:MAG TPA: antitoxin VapB family protein [Thermoanaerobaculia bacterium]
MSRKTIAVDARVYDRLAAAKRDGESFSKAIDRLLTEFAAAYTGDDILSGLATIAPLSVADAEVFMQVVAENRAREGQGERDLR